MSVQQSVAGVTIEKVDVRTLSDAQIVEINAYNNVLNAESMPEDPPRPVELTAAAVRNIPSFVVVKEFWARDESGALVATGSVGWTETEDNKHLAARGSPPRCCGCSPRRPRLRGER